MSAYRLKATLIPTISLFTSMGTLLCCALPSLFVALGAGAALAGLVSAVPQLVFLSKYKLWVFGIAGVMLVFAGWLRWRSRHDPCPVNPEEARACSRLKRVSLWLYTGSVSVYFIGAFFAFVAVRLFY